MSKHLALDIRDGHFTFTRKVDQIATESKLGGIYMSSAPAYKDLARVERSFRSMKTVDLEIRPIRPWSANRVRGACPPVQARLSRRLVAPRVLAPLLIHDTELEAAHAERSSPVAATEP